MVVLGARSARSDAGATGSTSALPLAIAFLLLVILYGVADPRARHAVALHRRAEVAQISRSIAETGHAERRGTRPSSSRSTPT